MLSDSNSQMDNIRLDTIFNKWYKKEPHWKLHINWAYKPQINIPYFLCLRIV